MEELAYDYRRHACTHDVVVVAAHGVGAARVTSAHTDDADGRAVKANEGVEIPEDNAQEAENSGDAGGVGLHSANRGSTPF